MFEDLGGDHHVEGAVRIGQRQCVTHDNLGLGRGRCLTGDCLQHGVDLGQLLGILVEGDHVGATSVGLVAVPAGSGADINDLGSASDAEPVVVHRQHGRSTAVTSRCAIPVRAIARS